MSLERGLEIIKSNYQIVDQDKVGDKVVIVTFSNIQPAEGAALNGEGWEVQGNTATFTLPKPVNPPAPPKETPPDQPDSTETS